MAKMQVMAKQGILPKRGAKCDIPICTSCLYGKATRKPWRTKPEKDSHESKLRTATEPGQCISVDQMESRTPGLIAQTKGWLTKKRYQAATIFVDHFSSLSYVCLQKSTNAEETMETKISFERYAKKTISRSEETKEDHLQTQREEVEDQVQTQEDQDLKWLNEEGAHRG
jgi:hypothetical protein